MRKCSLAAKHWCWLGFYQKPAKPLAPSLRKERVGHSQFDAPGGQEGGVRSHSRRRDSARGKTRCANVIPHYKGITSTTADPAERQRRACLLLHLSSLILQPLAFSLEPLLRRSLVIFSAPAKSAMVRATLTMRSCARALSFRPAAASFGNVKSHGCPLYDL